MFDNAPSKYHSLRRRANTAREQPLLSGLALPGSFLIHAPIRHGSCERGSDSARLARVRTESGESAWLAALLLVGLVLTPRVAEPDAGTAQTIQGSTPFGETFQQAPAGMFSSGWKIRGSEATAQAVYHMVAEGGNRFLHAYANNQTVPRLGIEYTCMLRDYPVFRCRLRTTKLPSGADERAQHTNDSAYGRLRDI